MEIFAASYERRAKRGNKKPEREGNLMIQQSY
jgi:hypothetical protein